MKINPDVQERIDRLASHKVLSDYVIVYVPHNKEKMMRNVIIPESVNTNGVMVDGYILACGPGMKNRKGMRYDMEIKVGDKVWIHRASMSSTTKFGDDVYITVRENEIVAVIED